MNNFNAMFPTFQKYTKEMYLGNAPCGKGWEQPDGSFCDRWSFYCGEAQTKEDEVVFARFNLNHKITVNIAGSSLWITDIRYSGKSMVYQYTNDDGFRTNNIAQVNLKELEPAKIESILDSEIDCDIWRMIQKRAKEIYYN